MTFLALNNVPTELAEISSLLSRSEVLQNTKFTVNNVKTKLEKTLYSILHFATHGHFSKTSNDTFLLTYEDKLTMGDLEKLIGTTTFRTTPVELLTLSACQTAVGDERAALGLAGIALKAGARSALASLWFVNDPATAQLMIAFYQNLIKGNLTKAQALQQAQQHLLTNTNYKHPYYWAAFLLIGNY